MTIPMRCPRCEKRYVIEESTVPALPEARLYVCTSCLSQFIAYRSPAREFGIATAEMERNGTRAEA